MRHFVLAGIALSTLTLVGSAAPAVQAQTIANAGFETPFLGTGNFSYGTQGASWTFGGSPGSGSGITGNNSAFTSSNPFAPEGVQVAFLQNLGSFSQTISGFESATQVSFSFFAAQRAIANSTPQSFNVLLNDVVIGSFLPTSTNYTQFTTGAGTLNAGANSNVLAFQGTNQVGDATAFIDLVQGTTVVANAPEPGSALLLIPGLLGLVGVVRRRISK